MLLTKELSSRAQHGNLLEPVSNIQYGFSNTHTFLMLCSLQAIVLLSIHYV